MNCVSCERKFQDGERVFEKAVGTYHYDDGIGYITTDEFIEAECEACELMPLEIKQSGKP